MKTEKFATSSVRKHRENQWIASYPYVAEIKHEIGPDGKERDVKVWRTKRRVLSTTGRDRGRSSRVYDAAVTEAEAVRRELNEEAEALATGHRPGQTVAEYVSSYIEGRRLHVERSTAAEYSRLLNKLIAPTLGSVELDALAPDAVQSWVNGLTKNYSSVTIRKALVLLRSSMKQAVERDRLTKDPTRGVKPPKQSAPRPNALDERGRAKVARFVAVDPSTPVNIGISLALYMGMREGEICGLKWRYVDLDNRILSVCETLGHDTTKRKRDLKKGEQQTNDNRRTYVKEPKTRGSVRDIPIPPVLLDALSKRKAELTSERIALGAGADLSDVYVLGSADGSFMQPNYLAKKWRAAAEALELVGTQGKRPTFHDLRHTFATAAIAHGVDIKTVSSAMGHSNAAMTMNTYADADPDAKRRGIQKLASAIEGESRAHAKDGDVLEFVRTGTEA